MVDDQTPLDIPDSAGLALNPLMLGYLNESAKWSRFLGIIGFLSCALVGIVAIGMLFISTPLSAEVFGGMGPVAIGLGYFAIAILMFFPALFMYRFGVRTLKALRMGSEEALTKGLENLKSWFRYYGILTIIGLVFYVLLIVFAIAGGMTYIL